MTDFSKVAHIQWRGSASHKRSDTISSGGDAFQGRILMLVGTEGNRNRIKEYLSHHYECIEPDEAERVVPSFDLAIIDIPNFHKWKDRLMDAKIREEPTFLPVILILSHTELRHRLRRHWDTIDEFIVAPIDKSEFSERIAMLMRARRLALSQHSHLMYLVTHDRVTGLPNKNLFMDRLINAVRDASILDVSLHVIVVHVSLSRIMKSLGHHGLERAAVAVSSRLHAVFNDQVTLARLTTEEWGILHRPGTAVTTIFEACHLIQSVSESPLQIENENIHISMRTGIGVYPDDASDALRTLDCAISALSKTTDSSPVFYSRDVQHQAIRYIRTESRLHEALEHDQFELWFQPQLRLSDLRVIGVEALVRWRLPSGELVPPGEFLSVAESTGMIVDITRWVMEKACATMHSWRESRLGLSRVAINVSAMDLMKPDFADNIFNLLDRYHLPPPAIELELTESTFLESNDHCLDALTRLRDYGSSIAIDDFGTGYSSLSYLHRLPITTVKIDKSFVDDIHQNATNAAITQTIVWLSQQFGLETVAEGIETDEQSAFLKSIEVNTAQGFLYARPMPENQLYDWILHHKE